MIYKLIVNAAFLAIGYYIGKQVGLSELVHRGASENPGTRRKSGGQQPPGRTPESPGG